MTVVIYRDDSQRVLETLERAVLAGLEACGMTAEGYAKGLCPVDTGRLRNSVTHQVAEERAVLIGSNVEYAPYVELGSWKQRAQPFLMPAVSDHAQTYERLLRRALSGE